MLPYNTDMAAIVNHFICIIGLVLLGDLCIIKGMRQPKLLKETLELLDATPENSHSIAKNSGLGFRWVYKLRARGFTDPGVNKIETLNIYLKSTKV